MANSYDQQYKAANYDSILIRVKKGKREEYRQAAEDLGLGLMEMFRRGTDEFICAHGGEVPVPVHEGEKLTAEQRRLLEEFGKLPVDVQNQLMKLVKSINANTHAPMSDQSPRL